MPRFGLAFALLVLPAIAGAQTATYVGRLRCVAIPHFTPGPMNAAFTVHADGNRLTYARTVQDRSGAPTPIVEQGTGTVTGDRVELHGSTAERSWRYEASYSGTLRGGVMDLTGHQLWSGQPVGGQFDRACQARLTAGG